MAPSLGTAQRCYTNSMHLVAALVLQDVPQCGRPCLKCQHATSLAVNQNKLCRLIFVLHMTEPYLLLKSAPLLPNAARKRLVSEFKRDRACQAAAW